MALLEIRGLHVSYGQIEAIHGVDMDAEAVFFRLPDR